VCNILSNTVSLRY